MDKNLNELLKWGIENSTPSTAPRGVQAIDAPADGASATTGANGTNGTEVAPAAPAAARTLDPEILASLFGGPSDADLMKAAMEVITSTDPEETMENRLIAFDNFEQLVESLDNANIMEKLALWTPLLGVLDSNEPELRRMAAWCLGTAVQNNQPSQERLLAVGGVPPLVKLAANKTETEGVRRKAIYALSSACRNYQPAMDACVDALNALETKVPTLSALPANVDATNMDAVDEVINGLKADL